MFNEKFSKENLEKKDFNNNGYKEIKPKGAVSKSEIKSFWDKIFKNNNIGVDNTISEESKKLENIKSLESENGELNKIINDYKEDLIERSEYKDTIKEENLFQISDLKTISSKEIANTRDKFDDMKSKLKQEWEKTHNRDWPTYKEDVYIKNKEGKLVKIREKGSDYDVHHILPLKFGGENEVRNITPLHADEHFDHKGVHKKDGPYGKLCKLLGGE